MQKWVGHFKNSLSVKIFFLFLLNNRKGEKRKFLYSVFPKILFGRLKFAFSTYRSPINIMVNMKYFYLRAVSGFTQFQNTNYGLTNEVRRTISAPSKMVLTSKTTTNNVSIDAVGKNYKCYEK